MANAEEHTTDPSQLLGLSIKAAIQRRPNQRFEPGMASTELSCCNCGLTHNASTSTSPNCFFITIRISGRSPNAALRSFQMPGSFSQRQQIRDWLWSQFQDIKEDNEISRQALKSKQVGACKGQLKSEQPIPWLSWCSPDGYKGQTRNKQNFHHVWEACMERPMRLSGASCWLSSTLLDAESLEQFRVERYQKSHDGCSVSSDSGYESCT